MRKLDLGKIKYTLPHVTRKKAAGRTKITRAPVQDNTHRAEIPFPMRQCKKQGEWSAKCERSKSEKRRRHECRRVVRTNPLKCAEWFDLTCRREEKRSLSNARTRLMPRCFRRVCEFEGGTHSCNTRSAHGSSCLRASISNQPPLVRRSTGGLCELDVCLAGSTCFHLRKNKPFNPTNRLKMSLNLWSLSGAGWGSTMSENLKAAVRATWKIKQI